MPSILRTKRSSRPPPIDASEPLEASEFGTPSKISRRLSLGGKNADTSSRNSDILSSRSLASKDGNNPSRQSLFIPEGSNQTSSSEQQFVMTEEPESATLAVPSDGRGAPRESLVQRVAERLNSPNGEGKRRRHHRRSRRASTSSAISQGHNIVAALANAKGGLQTGASPSDDVAKAANPRAVSTGRSPYLLRAHEDESDDGYGSEEESEGLSEGEGLENLPVTGFAVASNRRNAEFHSMFPSVDEGDYLIEDYGCALAKDILVHGRLYVSENHICFHSNLFGWVTDLIIPFAEVQEIEKKMTALVIPNAIGIVTSKERYTFASLISRDSTFDVLMNIWRIAHPGAVMAPSSAPNGTSRAPSVANESVAPETTGAHRSTVCACGKNGKHYSETALEAVFPSSPEKIYNLIFNSGWYRTFLSDNQKLRDIESSDWKPDENQQLSRSMTYIKPLNGSIGPKQTKCHIVDVHDHCDFDDYISMITTTRTPDVPSGGVFSVKTRTCFSWASAATTRMTVTTEVEWTGKSWVKGIIEKSAIDGQKQFHDDLASEMRAHMKQHPTEFAVAGAEDAAAADDAASADGPGPTEAQEYAAQNRRARQDADYWLLQGALDSVLSGLGSIGQGVKTAFDTVSDLLNDSPLSKTSLLMALIIILLASNVYTYLTRPTSQHKSKRLQRFGPSEDDVTEAVRIILARRAATTPKDEVVELLRILDDVDNRSTKLRASFQDILEHQTQSSLVEVD